MFRSLDHPQGATLFLAKVTSKTFIKFEQTVNSETSEIRTQTPGNYPKRNKLHLEQGETLKIRIHKIPLY